MNINMLSLFPLFTKPVLWIIIRYISSLILWILNKLSLLLRIFNIYFFRVFTVNRVFHILVFVLVASSTTDSFLIEWWMSKREVITWNTATTFLLNHIQTTLSRSWLVWVLVHNKHFSLHWLICRNNLLRWILLIIHIFGIIQVQPYRTFNIRDQMWSCRIHDSVLWPFIMAYRLCAIIIIYHLRNAHLIHLLCLVVFIQFI